MISESGTPTENVAAGDSPVTPLRNSLSKPPMMDVPPVKARL